MSITLNIVVAIALLVGISFTQVSIKSFEWKGKAFQSLPVQTVKKATTDPCKQSKDYLLPSVFLFDKNS